MFQWIEKFQTQQDEVILFIIAVFFLYLYTMKYNNQLKLLFSIFSLRRFLWISKVEKKINTLYFSNFILVFLSLLTFSFLIFFTVEKFEILSSKEMPFFWIFGLLTTLVVCRYLLLLLIFKISGHSKLFQLTAFKSIGLYGVIGAYGVFFFSIYYFGFNEEKKLLLVILMLMVIVILITHAGIYLKTIRTNPKYIVYLILYLCAFKLAPWILIYYRLD